jgi:uncharacterized protein
MEKGKINRRDFLRLTGLLASASLLSACTPATPEVTKVEKKIECSPEVVKVVETIEVPQECEPQVEVKQTFPFAPLFKAEASEMVSQSGYRFDIYVALPPSYPTPELRYPVLYFADADYMVSMVTSLVTILSMMGKIPEMVTVGIGYHSQNIDQFFEERGKNLLPVRDNSGGARFLEFLEEKAIPFIEETYPVTQERIFWGHSLGGSFALFAMLKSPSLFQHIHASSPGFDLNDYALHDIEAELAAQQPEIPASCLITIGSMEIEEGIADCKDFYDRLKGNGYKGLNVEYMELENEDHGSVAVPALYYGFPKLFPSGS